MQLKLFLLQFKNFCDIILVLRLVINIKDIYLVLSSSSSLPAKVIKRLTRNKINHSSISLDPTLNNMYSFGRIYMWNAFYGGFVVENKDEGFYQKFTDTYVEVYRLPVSDDIFEQTKICIDEFVSKKSELKYNALGLVLAKLQISFYRKNYYFCSEFVADVISECNIRKLERDIHTFRPFDFLELPDMYPIYKGMLSDYNTNSINSNLEVS